MTLHRNCVGIDVSKRWLDICEAEGCARIDNNAESIAGLAARWAKAGAFVVFEATGVYDRTLAAALSAAGVAFARVNPARARDFARAVGRIAKTDRIDAAMLARFAQTLEPPAEPAACPARKRLEMLGKRRDQLIAMRAAEKNRRENREPFMAEQIARCIAFLDTEIGALDAAIAAESTITPNSRPRPGCCAPPPVWARWRRASSWRACPNWDASIPSKSPASPALPL